MPPVINVKFDQHDHRVYCSGETLSGRVEVSCTKATLIRSISIQVLGFAKTFWDRTIVCSCKLNCIKRDHSTYYDHSGREEYMSKHIYLLGSPDATPVEFCSGLHKYEFSFDLSPTLPSSFEGAFGYIRYLAKVAIDRPNTSILTTVEKFAIINAFDLNKDSPVLKLRADVETVYEPGCLCCSSKPFQLKASVPQTGLIAGQIIPVRTEINNASNLDVRDVRFYLRKIITYYSNKRKRKSSKTDIVELVSVSCAYMVRKGCNKFEEFLAVPKTQSSTKDMNLGLIQISYDIKVEVVLHMWRKNPFVVLPITIGTVALKDVVQNEVTFNKNSKNYGADELEPLNGKAFGDNEDVYIEFIDE